MSSSRLHNLPASSKAGYFSRPENGMVSGNESESASRSGSIQLPSPPDSPPFSAHTQARGESQTGSSMRSRSTRSHSQTSQQGPPDYRFSPSRLKPSLNNTHSTPTALPFRPTANIAPNHASTSSSSVPSPSQRLTSPPPLISAFRNDPSSATSHSGSGSGSISSSAASSSTSYPHVSTSPPPSRGMMSPQMRSRSGSIASVASERPARTEFEPRMRPHDMHRRASMSTNVVPAPIGPRSPVISTSPFSSTLNIGPAASNSSSRTHLRMSEAPRTTPQYEPTSTLQQTAATSHFDLDLRGRSRVAMESSSSLAQARQGISSSLFPADRPSVLRPASVSRHSSRGPSSHAYVKAKDSPALRPLPASPFLHSPPQSPSTRSRAGTVSSGVASPYIATSRSRAGSVMQLGEPPRESSEGGSLHESGDDCSVNVDPRRSSRVTLPVWQPMSPLDFEPFSTHQYDRSSHSSHSPEQKKRY